MLQYLVILLDDRSVSFCHYNVPTGPSKLIPIDVLKQGILFGMKENLMIQFVYPKEPLPEEYIRLIDTIDHIDITSIPLSSNSSVIVYDAPDAMVADNLNKNGTYVLKCLKATLFESVEKLSQVLPRVQRLNIVIDDVASFGEEDFSRYGSFLKELSIAVEKILTQGQQCQVNILTDRMLLEKMNNCNAGENSVTLAPDGRFYPCPAFYYEKSGSKHMGLGGPEESPFSIGDIENGLRIKNPQLYKIDHAPICSRCDAFHCRRCIWLNRKTTKEINTPSHEQCVVAHIERNATRAMMESIKRKGFTLTAKDIPAIEYLDPFDIIIE